MNRVSDYDQSSDDDSGDVPTCRRRRARGAWRDVGGEGAVPADAAADAAAESGVSARLASLASH